MNGTAPTSRPRSRLGPRSRAHRIRLIGPFLLVGALLTLTPFLPQQAEAGGVDRSEEQVVVMPTVLPEASDGSTVVSFPWGDAPGEVGLAAPDGGERRGPESFAVASDGRIVILDSVNRRLVTVESPSTPAGTIPLQLRSPRFLAATTEQIHVLDADDDHRLQTFAWDGRLLADREIQEEEGPVTALLLDADGSPMIELAHDRTVAVGTPGEVRGLLATTPDSRGRPAGKSRDRWVTANTAGDGGARVEQRDNQRGLERSWSVEPSGRTHVDHVVSLDSDPDGRVILGVRLRDVPDKPRGTPGSLLLTRLDDQGGSLVLAESLYAHLGTPYAIGGDGRVYAPLADPAGYRIVVHSFPEVTR
ncbi:MAG: NHL repeat-containing protein [Thermoleophilia bacterium]